MRRRANVFSEWSSFSYLSGSGKDVNVGGFAGEVRDGFFLRFRERAVAPEDFGTQRVNVEVRMKSPSAPSSREVPVRAVIFVDRDLCSGRPSVRFYPCSPRFRSPLQSGWGRRQGVREVQSPNG